MPTPVRILPETAKIILFAANVELPLVGVNMSKC